MKVLIVFEGSIEVDVEAKSTNDRLTIDEAVDKAWWEIENYHVGENALIAYYDIVEDD